MTYSASIEWGPSGDAGCLRVHEGPDGVVGSPYVWSCTVFRQGVKGRLSGAIGSPTMGEARAIIAVMVANGITHRLIVRHGADGKRRTIVRGNGPIGQSGVRPACSFDQSYRREFIGEGQESVQGGLIGSAGVQASGTVQGTNR